MTEISKDFLKLIATLIIVLTIFLAVLNSGILESLFALKTYAEPLTLLDHLAAAIETASSCPGECSLSVRTSGLPYILEIYKENGNYYASIDASLVEQKSNVKFLPNQQKPVFTKPLVSDCVISEQKLAFTEGLIQDITIKKVFEGGTCKIFIESKKEYYDFNVSVEPDTVLVLNGTSSTTTVTVSLIGNQIAPGPVRLTVMGTPPGVTIMLSKDDSTPTFTSTMTITADPNAVQGIYNLTIMGKSGNLARTASLQIEVSPTLYTFILNSEINIVNLPLMNVGVNFNGINKYTRQYDESTSNIIYSMAPGSPCSVKVDDPFADPQGPRPFSHFRDFDCKGNNTGYILDTDANPYPFNIPNDWKLTYSRKMTAYYKAFTQIRNLEYDNVTNKISGNLLDEDFNSISKRETSYIACNVSITDYPNRNVTIEYLDTCNNSWLSLGSVASSFAGGRFYDKFDKDNKNWDINYGTWNITNGELNNSGIGYESIQTKWNFWNSSSNGNNNLEVSANLSSGGNLSIRVFDAINDYYLQTNDSYNKMYLWVNGAIKQSVSLTGINPSQWNIWRIKQNESYMEFYLNNKKLIRYNGVPVMGNGRIELRTYNTQAHFDNITAYDGSWSYNFSNMPCSIKKIRAAYISSDWYYNDTFADIDIDPATVLCKLTVSTQVDIPSKPLPGVEVNVSDGVLNKKYSNKTSVPLATAVYFLAATPLPIHNITVNDTFYLRNFSHYWDQDCDPLNVGYYLDTANNPYWFSMCRDKNITVQYETFTKITNNSGAPNTFNFNFSKSHTISGKLLDENNNSILNANGTKHSACTVPSVYDNITINRNVTLEYFKNESWYYINATDSLPNGNWSYDWDCACNATKLRANYTPTNWYYMPNSSVINITCPCKLLVFAQVDAYETPTKKWPLSPVQVNVSNSINWTDANGYVTYYLFPGNYYIKVDDPFNSRNFSHFFDNDCNKNKMGWWFDTAKNPYSFGMYDRDKNITAQYKANTYITDSNNTSSIFEYDGINIKGKLLDEKNDSIINIPFGQARYVCRDSSLPFDQVPINRNVSLEVYNSTDSKWYYLGATNSNANGYWSYAWTWTSGVNKIRANYTPLPANWYYNGSSAVLAMLRLRVNTFRDDTSNTPVNNTQVTFDGSTKSSDTNGIVEFILKGKNHNLMVENPKDTRPLSHFWDSDCDQNNLNYWLDNASNPYTFYTWDRDRNITAYYKSFTNITDSAGTNNMFDYNSYKISGKLFDERGIPIMTGPRTKHDSCEDPSKVNNNVPVNRNVTLEYYDGFWHYLNVTDSLADGSWSYDWVCACNTTKIRANYTPVSGNWFYVGKSVEKSIDPSTCPCNLTVFTFEEIYNSPISNVNVTLDSPPPNSTDSSGITYFLTTPGTHSLSVDLLTDGLPTSRFGHFRDFDCNQNNKGLLWDSNGISTSGALGTYTFNMYGRDRNITAFYKTFTYIANTSGAQSTFEYNGTHIKGNLLDNRSNVLKSSVNYYDPCGTLTLMNIDKNINLEYFDGSWHSLTTVPVQPDGSWSYPWACTAGVTQLRAAYMPTNWYYAYSNASMTLNCKGSLDVHAFAGGSEVNAIVALGLGDVNWDGFVNSNDENFYNPGGCYLSKIGDPNWDIDCDMIRNDIIDMFDALAVTGSPFFNDGSIPINTTPFTMDVNVGTYQLRAKYKSQIENNLSVVVNPAQTARVDFNFLTCDGYTNLTCDIPNPELGGQRVWLGSSDDCGRLGVGAKIDCEEGYDTHKVCNLASPTTCTLVNPTISGYSVSATSVLKDNPFSISVSGSCPNTLPTDLPGKCLVECRVTDPDGIITDFDTWTDDPTSVTFSTTCQKEGNYIVNYCGVYTDFQKNRGWGAMDNSGKTVQCLPSYPLTFIAQQEVTGTPLSGVTVNIFNSSGNLLFTNTTYSDGSVIIKLSADNYAMSVQCQAGSSTWSHFTDYDCNGAGSQWDFIGSLGCPNYQTMFTMYNKPRTFAAYYRAFTKIIGMGFDGTFITGKLQDDTNKGLIGGKTIYTCGGSSAKSVNKNISLEYHNQSDGNWYPISVSPIATPSPNDGSWSLGWTCGSSYADQIRATYTPDSDNWWYMGTSTVYTLTTACPPPSYTLTFTAQVDVTGRPLTGATITVDGTPYSTGLGSTVNIPLTVGSHTINSISTLVSGEWFSHIADFDCDGSGSNTWDHVTPYSFTMYAKDRSMTAQYKTNTHITMSFSGSTISGSLLDENNNPIVPCGNIHTSCSSTGVCTPLNRNVRLGYCNDTSCYNIGPADASTGSWSQSWSCGTTGATLLAATYDPGSDWWYMGKYVTIPISCPKNCGDGTPSGSCSATKPLYCNNGVLENRCGTCHCNGSDVCNSDGTCSPAPPPSCTGVPNICPSLDEGSCTTCKCSGYNGATSICEGTVACSSLTQTYCTACGCTWG